MSRLLPLLVYIFFCAVGQSQVVINEIDVDTPSTDTMEFVELLSDTPEQPLDDFVLVLLMVRQVVVIAATLL